MIQYTLIDGLLVFEGFKFTDLRGSLIKPYSKLFFKDENEEKNLDFKEVWFTKSKKNVNSSALYKNKPRKIVL